MNILFMCLANSARSQLAEGLAREIFPEASVKSAGSHPGQLNSFAIQAMEEIGIDISKQFSKSIDHLSPKFIGDLKYIITLCAEEVCPTMVAIGAKRFHWPFPDPASKEPLPDDVTLKRFREARDAIQSRLIEFKKEVGQ
jgi:arsenate reductase (thioredoxin)